MEMSAHPMSRAAGSDATPAVARTIGLDVGNHFELGHDPVIGRYTGFQKIWNFAQEPQRLASARSTAKTPVPMACEAARRWVCARASNEMSLDVSAHSKSRLDQGQGRRTGP